MLATYIEIGILTAINSIGVVIILLSLVTSLQNKSHRWLVVTTISALGWCNFAYLGYIENSVEDALLFYRINGAFVISFLFSLNMFVESVLKRSNKLLNLTLFLTSVSLIYIEMSTNLIVDSVVPQYWGNEIVFGPLNILFYLFSLFIGFRVFLVLAINYSRRSIIEKKKVIYLMAGIFAFGISNILFNIILPQSIESVRFQHLGDYSAIFFLIPAAYAILKYEYIATRTIIISFLMGLVIMFISTIVLTMLNGSMNALLQSTTLPILEIVALAIINSGSIFLIITLLANSTGNMLYRWFAIMTMCIMAWVNLSYLGYSSNDPELSLIFFRLNMAVVSFCFISEYMVYIEEFLQIRVKVLKWLVVIISSVLIALSLFTDTIISEVVVKEWGNEIQYGDVNNFYSLFALVLNLSLCVVFIRAYIKFEKQEKRKVLYFLIGTFLFILLNIIFNIVVPVVLETSRYQRLGDYSSVIFLIFTAYAIVRRRFMNVKIALTAFLIGIVGMLIVVDIFTLSRNITEQLLKSVIFLLFSIVSYYLVRSVLQEIKQREELAVANKELDESRQKYQDLASEQKDIIDVMGHEIRTPLTAIIQAVKLHKKYTFPDEKEILKEAEGSKLLARSTPLFFDAIKTVDRASSHAASLVSDMLETARLDKQRFELNYEEFDLVQSIKESVDMAKLSIDESLDKFAYSIAYENSSELNKLQVNADKTRIIQALYAVLNNSVKYRDQSKDKLIVNVRLEKRGLQVQITIEDNGIGIAKEDLSRLGRKFLRLNPKTEGNLKRPGGTGLGLFVVKGILAHHGGDLIIESDGIHKGSKFILQFPIQPKSK